MRHCGSSAIKKGEGSRTFGLWELGRFSVLLRSVTGLGHEGVVRITFCMVDEACQSVSAKLL